MCAQLRVAPQLLAEQRFFGGAAARVGWRRTAALHRACPLLADAPISRSRALAADATSKLHVARHDRNALAVDGAQVGVFEQTDEVGLRRLLERVEARRLEAPVLRPSSCTISRQRRWKGSLRISSSVPRWYLRISRRATVPGRKRCGLRGAMTPPVPGGPCLCALTASCLRGALPPVDLRAVCFVRAMRVWWWWWW